MSHLNKLEAEGEGLHCNSCQRTSLVKMNSVPESSTRSYSNFCRVLDNQDGPSESSAGQARGGNLQKPTSLTVRPHTSSAENQLRTNFLVATMSIRRHLIGRHTLFRTPYGSKPLVYCDWTATGRAVSSIEDYIRSEVLPYFGNTHTTTSITGEQTTCFRHEARQIVAQAVNAKITGRAAEDVVLFTGTGATAGVAKLVSALGLSGSLPPDLRPDDRPVIFVGPFEHHSNLLPWRESYGEVVAIRENDSGGLDLLELEDKLRLFASRKLKIGSFTAASNVTGVLEEVDRVTAILHRAGALAFWDYATAAPHVRVDMNPVPSETDDQALVAKDAVFFSGHKFVGGPGSPGVLVVKKRLLCNPVPSTVGGGTVFFVTQHDHRYVSNKEEREEGGTPDILGSIRLGLAVQMKEALGYQAILDREEELATLGLRTLRAHPGIVILGDSDRKRLPIFSFLVRSKGDGRFLHYNFVCALLNDLFGVQSRGGCQCAGPYSQRLLGMSMRDTRAVEAELLCKHELLRPGFSRLSLSYVNSDSEAKYILDAVLFVAENGAAFLPQYRVNYKTGEWKHKTRFTRFPERRWLGHCGYGFSSTRRGSRDANGAAVSGVGAHGNGDGASSELTEMMEAREERALMEEVFMDAARHLRVAEAGSGEDRWRGAEDVLGEAGEALRWFPYPWEGGVSQETTPPLASPGSFRQRVINPKVYLRSGGRDLEALDGVNAIIDGPSVDRRENGASAGEDDMSEGAADLAEGDGTVTPAERASSGGNSVILDKEVKQVAKVETACALATDNGRRVPERIEGEIGRSGVEQGADAVVPNVLEESTSLKLSPNDITIPSKSRKVDDSHKYPLRTSGAAGFHATAPPFLSTKNSAEVERGETNGHSSKLKGYEGHLSALEKLGSGSPTSRLFPKPGKKLMKAVGQAIQEWKMIMDGDRLCLGLSGGKDSMTLLHVLLDLRKKAPIRFELVCATVDPQTPSFDPSPLIPYLERLGVKLHYISSPIIEQAKTSLRGDSLCAFCARMKRGLLYACCREHGYNKLVLAQHLDDLAESFIMSTLHNGQVRTMKANYEIEAGDVRVIRPLCYARESLTKDFARTNRLPIVNENCPACFEEPKERHRVKKMLAKEELLFPAIYANLRRALVPLMDYSVYEAIDKTSSEVASRQGLRRTQPTTKVNNVTDIENGEDVAERDGQRTSFQQGPSTSSSVALDSVTGHRDGIDFAPAPGCGEARLCLEKISDEDLEKELLRRRGNRDRGPETREEESVVVASSFKESCTSDGGVCVPCFEIA